MLYHSIKKSLLLKDIANIQLSFYYITIFSTKIFIFYKNIIIRQIIIYNYILSEIHHSQEKSRCHVRKVDWLRKFLSVFSYLRFHYFTRRGYTAPYQDNENKILSSAIYTQNRTASHHPSRNKGPYDSQQATTVRVRYARILPARFLRNSDRRLTAD